MSRFVGSGLVVLFLCLGFWTFPTAAKEKPEKSTSTTAAEAEARESLRQALVAETRGDNDERAKHLTAATVAVGDLKETNWHRARILADGKWQSLADFEAAAANDSKLLEYRTLRGKATNPKLVLALARWCVKNGWEELANLHYLQLLATPQAAKTVRAEAMKRLDMREVEGKWVSKEELDARRQEQAGIADALAKWRPRLAPLLAAIDSTDADIRDKSIAEFHKIDDPQVIPAIESFSVVAGDRSSEEMVNRLTTFPQYEATEALARVAITSDFVAARSLANRALKSRDLHEYCPLMLGALISPIQSRYQVITNADGSMHYTFAVSQVGPEHEIALVTQHAWVPQFYRTRFEQNPYGRWMLNPEYGIAHSAEVNAALQDAQLKNLWVLLANVQPNDTNRRIFAALTETTGVQLPSDAQQWWQWWKDYNEYHWPKSSQYVYRWTATCAYLPVPFEKEHVRGSCFLAGTPVRTQTGLAAIETIQPGDRVLSQDQDTGELAYKLVLRTTLRPPAEMLEITAGSEKIATTLGHPFWVSGHGWRMAKQLKVGDLLHSTGGAVRIDAIEPLPKQPAHNLVVADFNSYFVGNQCLLVHDNEYRKPTRAIVPGLVVDE